MSLADELERLAQLRNSGALSAFEFESAKRKLLAGESTSPSIEQLNSIQIQNEIAQLDRQWQIDRDKFLVYGKRGSRIPTKGGSLAQGFFIGVFGVFWTFMALSIGGATGMTPVVYFFPVMGVLFTLFGIGTAWYSYSKAEAYEVAEREYKQARAQLLKKQA